MIFNELTKEQIQYAKKVYTDKSRTWDDRIMTLTNYFGMCERTVRTWCMKLGFKERVEVESEQYEEAKQRKVDKSKRRFIITWGQNNTPVHSKFFDNILAYAKHIDAGIHVIAGRYKNPTSTFPEVNEDFWDDDIIPYLDAGRHDIHKYVSVMADIKIQPTAANPMSGMQGMSGINSCIFGSPKVQMEMIPVLEGCKPKMMLTTGAVTMKNYTDSKSGKKGEFHHTLGFTIVEIKDKSTFFVRQVTAHHKTGAFSDLYFHVDNEKITKLKSIAGIIWGDLHSGHHDPHLVKKTHALLKVLVPETVVLHDVFDGGSINHHESKDAFLQFGKEMKGTNSLEKEVKSMISLLEPFTGYKNVVIDRSNHDDFLDRWLKNEDWKRQSTSKNSLLYMEYSAMLLKQYAKNPYKAKGVIPEIINQHYPKFITLGRSDSYKVLDWEVGQHGDVGASGSRGSLLQFRKLNTKIIVGHYHCMPGRYKVQTKDSGWSEIRSLKVGDEILTYDPISGCNEWNLVDEFIENDYQGIMLQIRGNGFEQTFTDKHMLMMRNGDYICAAEAICGRSSCELPLTANYTSDYGIDIPEKIVRQIVAIAADGSSDKYRIRFHLKKERKIKRLKELFGDDLIIYSDIENHFDGFISTRSNVFKEILKYKNLKTQKKLSTEVLNWSPDTLRILEDELCHWDGTFIENDTTGRQWSTTSKVELNVVTSILNRLGYSLSFNKREYENEKHKTLYIITWCVDKNFNRNTKKLNHDNRFNGWGFNSYQANCKVYCVSVKNKCFWVQSDETGDVSLTGNSPGRKDGALSVGTSTHMRVGYNIGASAWLQSHVIIHNDGKAQHLNFINGEFTTLDYR